MGSLKGKAKDIFPDLSKIPALLDAPVSGVLVGGAVVSGALDS